jgi:hypothetical protein
MWQCACGSIRTIQYEAKRFKFLPRWKWNVVYRGKCAQCGHTAPGGYIVSNISPVDLYNMLKDDVDPKYNIW